LAVLLLIGLSLAPGQNRTGMLLLDTARINRYDIAVPVFGLAALWWFNHAQRRGHRRTYVISGGLAGLAGLSQMYGVFWLLALWSILWLRQGRRFFTQPAPYLLLAGFGVIWIPWLMYVATGWPDFLGQLRIAADRFDVLNPRFYVDNLLHEIERYRQLDVRQADGTLDFARPGLWIAALGSVGAAAVWLRPDRPRRAAAVRVLLVIVIVQVVLFALLLKSKNLNYLIAWWPLVALLLAWLMIDIWDRFPRRAVRGLVALALGLIIIEGGLRVQQQHAAALQATPYNDFVARLAAMIPLNARVLGLPQFALGLRCYEYRTWLLPFLLSDPRYTDNVVTLDQALERIRPDVILIDRAMAEYLAEMSSVANPDHVRYEQYQGFMQRHHAQLIGSIDDATYGQVRLFQIAYTEAVRP
jgi:hypothetical protein